ncbi:MFS transporter [Lactiplantibacillus xiangfangensis]|uniref:Sugar transport protein n=1 Tax=Lactiplantibacillus xiangfangensis TaxID=942150 RepID=A0A0R2MIQ9_9LACO|nr:MFS transporter [Lactiplantibacillus xiangfangensis]KRO11597.1 sugar transport protein [Lactiplantibacillus xiangfangensis]
MNKLRASFTNTSALQLVLIAAVASYLDAALIVSIGVALPIWTNEFSLSSLMAGGLSTVLTLMIAVGSFTGGWLSDKFGRIRVFNIDIFFVFVGVMIIAFAQNLPMLFVGIVLAGLSSGADLPTSLAVISERMSREDYGKAIAITQEFWIFGIIFSQLIGFITAGLGKHAATIIFILLGIIALSNWSIRVFSKKMKRIEASLVTSPKSVAPAHQQQSVLKQLIQNPKTGYAVLILTLYYLFWNLPANTWGSFINYFLVVASKQSQSTATAVAFIANLVGFFINMWYIKKADTIYRYRFMSIGIFAALSAFIVAGIFSEVWYVFSAMYLVYSVSTVFCGESLYKIWSQMLYPEKMRASFTGFSYGIVRLLTAGFALITPTIMAISPKALMWTLSTCVVGYGICAFIILKIIKKYHVIDPTIK